EISKNDDIFKPSFSKNSFLFQTTSKNELIFNYLDLSLPVVIPINKEGYLKTILKKTDPFKCIYTSHLVALLCKSEQFFSENSFSKLLQLEKIDKKDILNSFECTFAGTLPEISKFSLKTFKPQNINYDDRYITNNSTIFITDQLFEYLTNNNFILLFSIRTLVKKIIKFLDYKAIRINFQEAVNSFSYLHLADNESYIEVCDSEDLRIVISCNSFFTCSEDGNFHETGETPDQNTKDVFTNNKIKSIYNVPNRPSNVKMVLSSNSIITQDHINSNSEDKTINALFYLQKIVDLPNGDFIFHNGTIYKLSREGDMFSVEGLTLDNFITFE
ncbi:hypothetical protein M153_6540004872, partial [Pseudoloma neurophilia]